MKQLHRSIVFNVSLVVETCRLVSTDATIALDSLDFTMELPFQCVHVCLYGEAIGVSQITFVAGSKGCGWMRILLNVSLSLSPLLSLFPIGWKDEFWVNISTVDMIIPHQNAHWNDPAFHFKCSLKAPSWLNHLHSPKDKCQQNAHIFSPPHFTREE